MEANEPKKKGTLRIYLIVLAISAVCAAIGLDMIAAALIAAAAFAWKPYRSIIMLAVCVAAICATGYSYILQCIPSFCFLIAGLLFGILYRAKAPYRIILILVSVLCIAAVLGTDFITISQSGIKIDELIVERLQLEDTSIISDTGLDIEALYFAAEVFSAMIIAGILFVMTRIAAVFMISAAELKVQEGNPPIRMIAPFRLWMLSENFTFGLIAAAVAVAAVNIAQLQSAAVVSYTLIVIFGLPIFVQGFSFLLYITYRQRRMGAGLPIILLTIAGAAFTAVFSLPALGLADQFGRIRARALKRAMQNIDNENDENSKQ